MKNVTSFQHSLIYFHKWGRLIFLNFLTWLWDLLFFEMSKYQSLSIQDICHQGYGQKFKPWYSLVLPVGQIFLGGYYEHTILYWSGYLPIPFSTNQLILSNVSIWKVKITPLKCPYVLAGHASGCWHFALGAGVP